jgi:hypothetical protein
MWPTVLPRYEGSAMHRVEYLIVPASLSVGRRGVVPRTRQCMLVGSRIVQVRSCKAREAPGKSSCASFRDRGALVAPGQRRRVSAPATHTR